MSTITLVYSDVYGYIPDYLKKNLDKSVKHIRSMNNKCKCGGKKPPKK